MDSLIDSLGITFQFDRNAGILRTKAEGVVNYEELYDQLIKERQAVGLSWPEIVDAQTASFQISDGEVLLNRLRCIKREPTEREFVLKTMQERAGTVDVEKVRPQIL